MTWLIFDAKELLSTTTTILLQITFLRQQQQQHNGELLYNLLSDGSPTVSSARDVRRIYRIRTHVSRITLGRR
jgi:hypothetical protein